MKRRTLPAAILAVSALVFTPMARADDLKAMEGRWTVEAMEAGGKAVDSADLAKALAVTIAGDHYELMTDEGPDGGTLKLDETQNPKTMDATDTEGIEVGKLIRAIYELSGDTLRVCYAVDGSARPTEFATKEDSPLLLVTYKREK